MNLPNNVTEEQFVQAVDKISRMLAAGFKFGCHTVEDIKQEAAVFALKALDKYDSSRPLDNFLYTHIRNRLINFKRDNFRRTDCPCKLCHGMLPGQTRHEGGQFCDKYLVWAERNTSKQNIMNPLDITNINDEAEPNTKIESSVVMEACASESLEKIDYELPVELRATYLQMKEGISIPKTRRDEVVNAVSFILGEDVYE